MRPDREVDLAPIRAAFQRSGMSSHDLAIAMGWTRPDTSAVRRALGLVDEFRGGEGRGRRRERCSYERAVRLVRAMGMDPAEFDL